MSKRKRKKPLKHFLKLNDFSAKEILELVKLAEKLKKEWEGNKDQTKILRGKNLGIVFHKPSLRTRISFELAIKELGGNSVVMRDDEMKMGGREPIADISRVFSEYLDGLAIRTFGQEIIEELAENSSIPVINALTDLEHPCQILADLLTIKEHYKKFDGLKVAFIGDGNNVAHSLMEACTLLGMQFHIACPIGHEPDKVYESEFTTVCHSVGEAAQDADVLYTDVWASMGQENEADDRKNAFSGFQISSGLLEDNAKKGSIVLHCLPAHRGEEIAPEVMEDQASTIFRQAQNRLHAQKALLVHLMKN